jgi:hypothetical protein
MVVERFFLLALTFVNFDNFVPARIAGFFVLINFKND